MRTKTPSSCCESSCCGGKAAAKTDPKTLQIDFLYLDLGTCDRCQGTDGRLDEALREIRTVLTAAGVDAVVNKVHVTTEQQAKELAFVSSPTVRINGRDIQLDAKESECRACGELAECEVDCRVWTWKGKDYNVPPREMLVDAVLREVYANADKPARQPERLKELPANLKKFFKNRR